MKSVFLLFFLFVVLSIDSIDAARGRGGGRSRSSSSRSSSRSRSSGSRSTRRSPKYGPYKGTVTKYTAIPVRTKTTPVIIKQTIVPSRSTSIYTKLFVGYVVYRYALPNRPVYRQRYTRPSYYGQSEVVIPEERAIRVTKIEEKFLDSNGQSCLGENDERKLLPDINERVLFVSCEVVYADGRRKNYVGDSARNVEIDKSVLDQDVQVTTLVKYNGTIIENTNCTQTKSDMEGTVVRLYATNPDKAGMISAGRIVIILAALVCFLSTLA